jgi:hypothetical protein
VALNREHLPSRKDRDTSLKSAVEESKQLLNSSFECGPRLAPFIW